MSQFCADTVAAVDGEAQLRNIAELATISGRRFPLVFADGAAAADIVAAAYLARSRALLRAMFELAQVNCGDTIGIQLRTLYEVWLAAEYVLEAGDEALELLQLAQVFHRNRLTRRLELDEDLEVELDADLGEPRDVAVTEIRDKLVKKLKARGASSEMATTAYDTLYRPESYLNSHAGLGSIEGYVRPAGETWQVLPVRPDAKTPMFRLATAAAMVFELTYRVWERLGLEVAELEELKTRWVTLDEVD